MEQRTLEAGVGRRGETEGHRRGQLGLGASNATLGVVLADRWLAGLDRHR